MTVLETGCPRSGSQQGGVHGEGWFWLSDWYLLIVPSYGRGDKEREGERDGERQREREREREGEREISSPAHKASLLLGFGPPLRCSFILNNISQTLSPDTATRWEDSGVSR